MLAEDCKVSETDGRHKAVKYIAMQIQNARPRMQY